MKKENNITCTQAQPCYFDYLTGQQNSASEMEFEHIKHCSQCQDQIKRLEQEIGKKYNSFDNTPAILAMHHRHLSTWIDCNVIKPFLASQAHRQLRIEAQTPVTVHIARCQACQHDLQTMLSLELSGPQLVEAAGILSDEPCGCQHLDERAVAAIGGIRNRKASGIVTRLQTDDSGRPHVQVRHADPMPLSRRHFLIRFTAAAGILLVASLVIMMTTAVGGVSIQDVYTAIGSIENCRIEINSVDKEIHATIQKILISRKLNLAVSQQKDQTVILDFQNKKILKSTPETGVVTETSETILLTTMNRAGFGLLPFDSITQIPAGYRWKRQDPVQPTAEYEVYELSWVESSVGSIERTWRGYLLRGSHLPVRIEWLETRPDKAQDIVTEAIIQYPDTQTVLKELQANPLYQFLEGDQIK